MQKESSLITVSSLIKKFVLAVIIITILVFCWNTFKNIPGPIGPRPPATTGYSYKTEKPLSSDFKPTALKSPVGTSLYSKTILSKGEFPAITESAYIYAVSRSTEDFSTGNYANTIASKFKFKVTDRAYQDRSILWKNNNSNLIFDRTDLSIDFFLTNPSITPTLSDIDKRETFDDLNEYILSLGLKLNTFNLSSPSIFQTKYGNANVYFREVDYIAMTDSSFLKYKDENKVPVKAKILDKNTYSGELTAEVKEAEKFHSSNVVRFSYTPLNIEPDPGTAGVYKLLNLNLAFQEINTYKVETNSDNEEEVQSGNLYNFITFSNESYFDPVDVSKISNLQINAPQTTLAYVVNNTGNTLYSHPIYVFTGEGTLDENQPFTFFIYVDALPKT